MIKSIIFDLSGVLFSNGLKIGVDQIHNKYKLNKDHLNELLNGPPAENYRTGKETPDKFWQNIQDQFFITDEECADIKKLWFDGYRIKTDMVENINKLKHLGIRVYYLSDNPPDRAAYLDKKHGFISLFDGGVFSYQAHARKPGKEIFEHLLSELHTSHDQILYLDDKESNLKPAEELGLLTYLFDTGDAFVDYLSKKHKIYLI